MKTFSWPLFTKTEAELVSKVLLSNDVNYLFGKKGKEFEKNFSNYVGTKYALALANGTLALDLALRALDIKNGDEVLVTSRSFIASASAISILGGKPVFVDVDLNTQNISPEQIIQNITSKTKGIVCVHFAGMPCEMNQILKIAKAHKLWILEDCAQAHGAKIGSKSVGSFGDIAAWSFCNDKIMTTGGEGGMITTNSDKIYRYCESFNNHGKNFKKYLAQRKHLKFPYVHDSLGSNYRLTEMQSSIGIFQLKKLNAWNKIRERNANILIQSLKHFRILSFPKLSSRIRHGWYKLYFTLNQDYSKILNPRAVIIEEINNSGIFCSFGGCGEIYNEEAFSYLELSQKFKLPNANFLENNSIMFEIHPTITSSEMRRRARLIAKILSKYSL